MTGSLLTAANWPIIGQICTLLGKVMNAIYMMLDNILTTDQGLVGLSIIIYTILVYTCMMPLTIKQQRTSKMTSVMNPEIQAIQKKYRNKRDQASMLKQQEEMQQVYDKYGTSMMSGCLPLLIQMPLLFALYPVIYDIQDYIPALEGAPAAVNQFLTIPDLTISPWTMIRHSGDYGLPAAVIIVTAILLPVLSALTQFGSIKLSQAISGTVIDKDNPLAGTMRTMNVTMPLFSVFTLPTGIGIYWIVSAVVRCIQQIFINKHLSKMSVDELIEKNKEKAEKKQKKRGERAERINAMAQTNTRSLSASARKQASSMSEKEREEKVAKAKANADQAKAGSLAAKANMVKKFNENK